MSRRSSKVPARKSNAPIFCSKRMRDGPMRELPKLWIVARKPLKTCGNGLSNRASRHARWQAARHAPERKAAGRRTRGKDHCPATWQASSRLWKMDPAFAGPQGGGVGDCRCGELPNGAPDAKKNGMGTKRAIQYWVIPPEADAEFVAHMEDVLDVYSRPFNANVPVLCMDEQPVQLIEEVKCPIEATKDHPQRVDYEYKRAGVANIFMFVEPLAG